MQCCNAMLLIEEARSTFISKSINGGDTCLTMLEVFSISIQLEVLTFYLSIANRDPTLQTLLSFYVGRAFFQLLPGIIHYSKGMVDGRYHGRSVIDILGSKLDLLIASIRSGTVTRGDDRFVEVCF